MRSARYKSARGGRGSSKSHTFAQLAVMRMAGRLPDYPLGPVRIASARQFQNSIEESVKTVIEAYVKSMGLSSEFRVQKFSIDCTSTGSHMWFPGFTRNPESLLSTEGMDVLWIEQAETIGDEAEIIIPTVRKAGSELWFTWNPSNRAQWCWKRFVLQPRADDVSALVNWMDNPWWHESALEGERLAFLRDEPDRYAHVYMGQPDDTDGAHHVLTYGMVEACRRAYVEGLAPGAGAYQAIAGLDIAEGGANKCCLVIRTGPVVHYLDVWPGVAGDLSQAAMRAHEACVEHGVTRLYYDGSSPIRTDFLRLLPSYAVRPIAFGGKVGGPDVRYERGRANKDVFGALNIQMADALRLRAGRTLRLLDGDTSVDPYQCLFISDQLPQCDTYLAELTQPIRRIPPGSGKWTLDKRGGDEQAESPDRFDGTCLSFVDDTRRLRAG